MLLLAFDVTVLIAVATVLGWAGQTVKLCGDVAMQVDIPDESRGEVFAIQDAVFNLMFIGGVTLAALIVPADGKAVTLVLIGAASYATALLVVLRRQSFAAR